MMRRVSSVMSAVIYTGAVFMAGMLVGQLYALYVLFYTGAVFMVGAWLGQRYERRWSDQRLEAESSTGEQEEMLDQKSFAARIKGG